MLIVPDSGPMFLPSFSLSPSPQTANAMEGDSAHCLAAGMNFYLSKPLQVQVLCAALSTAYQAQTAAYGVKSPPPITNGVNK